MRHLLEQWRKVAVPDAEGWWYHTGDGDPIAYHGSGWVHMGTRKAAESRRRIWADRGMWRMRINPRNPANSIYKAAEDYDANRIDQWLSWGSPLDENGDPYVPQEWESNSRDQSDLDQAIDIIGFKPGVHDAIYYGNRVEDPGSVSVMVAPSAITKIEFVDQQLRLFSNILNLTGFEVGDRVRVLHPEIGFPVGGEVTGYIPLDHNLMVRFDGIEQVAIVPVEMAEREKPDA